MTNSRDLKSSKTLPYSLNKKKYLTDQEYDHLIELLHAHKERDLRNCLLLFLALFTGARATELLNLKVSDLDENDQTLFIQGIKGSNNREIPLAPWLFQLCKQYVRQNHISRRLFPITYNRLLQIWQFYRPVEKKFHALRHTFAIRLYKKTKDIRLLQVALGHRNIMNTMIYADYVYSQEELKKLIL